MFLLHRRFSRRCGTECHDLHMTNVMSSRRGCYDAVISGVIGPGQRGGSGGGRVKRGLRPRSACINRCWGAAERAHPQQRRRSREAGAPSSKRPQALKRGHSPASGTRRVPLSQAVHPRARKTPRSETKKQQRRSREAGAPSSRRPSAAEGALPRVARPRSCGGNRLREAAQAPLPAHQIQKSPYPLPNGRRYGNL